MLESRATVLSNPLGDEAMTPAPLYLVGNARNPQGGFARDSLCRKTAMVDPRSDVRRLERRVGHLRPAPPHVEEFLAGPSQPEGSAIIVTVVECRFSPQPLARHLASRGQQVRMKVSGIASSEIPWSVNHRIHGESEALRKLLG